MRQRVSQEPFNGSTGRCFLFSGRSHVQGSAAFDEEIYVHGCKCGHQMWQPSLVDILLLACRLQNLYLSDGSRVYFYMQHSALSVSQKAMRRVAGWSGAPAGRSASASPPRPPFCRSTARLALRSGSFVAVPLHALTSTRQWGSLP